MLFDNYWSLQTVIFSVIFLAAVFISTRKKRGSSAMSKETSNELRGLAILGILFAHLTYGKFLGTDFLFPLGIWAGVAVNLFLFLSCYGLAASAIYNPKKPLEFYLKRVIKIFLPLWIFLIVILISDAIFLNRIYGWQEIVSAFIGFFPKADLFASINSPLWFLTPLLFYYIVFPLVFQPKHPRWSIVAVSAVSLLPFIPNMPLTEQMIGLYKTHFLAFPLGVVFAALIVSPQAVCSICARNGKCLSYRWLLSAFVKGADVCSKPIARAINAASSLSAGWRAAILIILAGLAWQTAYHSGVGRGIWLEQGYALFTMFCIIFFFIFKKTKSSFLELVGIYSFEIYLWHWPLISRYDIFYRFLPPWLATALYLPLLLLIAYLFHRLALLIENRIFRIKKSS